MKKIIILLSAIALTTSAFGQAQTDRRNWIDIQLVQHIGLNKWSYADLVNDGFPGTSMTELRGVFNFFLGNSRVGAFADAGIAIMPAPRMRTLDLDRLPMPNSGTQYYLREITSQSGTSSASAHMKMTFGMFGKMTVNEKFNVMPYVGVGFLTMPQRRYEVTLKEQGSNTQYDATYIWNFRTRNENETAATLGYLTGRVNFSYRLAPRSSLLLGLEYTWFLNTVDFYGKFANSFNANVWRDFRVKGNNMNMLGLSVSVSFM